MKFSDVTVDLAARVIHRGEEEVHLTPIEFRLLAVLLNNAGKCSPSASYSIRCGGQTRSNTVTICVFIWDICGQKLEQDPARPRHFITETGIGVSVLCHECLFNKCA
ncbi:two-component response regulator [Escherichia coli]|uniref:Two-component response regulator n=1 Tax=Escherichia coli TaxID=562 RepID=A0A376UDH0_ECOLX|nr:two-component response regulator [Escherichia coli]